MPVPRRRKTSVLVQIKTVVFNPSKYLFKLLNVDFVFQNTKTLLLWGFTPAVIYIGLQTEPKPTLFDIFNIFE